MRKNKIMAIYRRNRNRHGVLLLIILALLAMFGATAIAFVILTRSQKGGADAFHQEARDTENPEKLLNEAAAQVLRGTNHANSVIGPHSLLEDVYGNEPLNGCLLDGWGNEIFEAAIAIWHDLTDTDRVIATKPSLVAGGQIIEFTVRGTTEVVQRLPGRVLTFTGGSFAGISTRILTFRQAALSDGTLLTWPTTDSDVNYRDQPVWRIQVVADGLLPFGHDGRPGVPNYDDDNDDGDNNTATSADNPEEYAWPYPNPPYGNSDDLKPGTHSASGTPFIVNGTAFCGTGFGFDPNVNDPTEPNVPYLSRTVEGQSAELALLPRHPQIGDVEIGAIGGANEDYDAVDYQNMLLGSDLPLIDTDGDGKADTNIPSLHRPSLANYWFRWMLANVPEVASLGDDTEKWKAILQPYGADYRSGGEGVDKDAAGADKIIALKRCFMMRPLPEDHPNFDGSNPASRQLPPDPAEYATRNWERIGPWDVDNDGDGVPDSIWVDIGLPVRSTPDGRLYKPLVAILCTDLDGRLNLNAHGCIAQTEASYYSNITPATGYAFAGSPPDAMLLRGLGCGPAEVNLGVLFWAGAPNPTLNDQYQRLLFGVNGLDGRYGESNLLGSSLPGPGHSLANDPLSLNRLFNYPAQYFTSVPVTSNPGIAPANLRSYGSPSDLKGSLAVGLDLAGHPIYTATADPTGASALANHPYELDLSRKGASRLLGTPGMVDNPFSASELETLLRCYDVDAAMLPRRLPTLAANLNVARRIVTTDSWDVPCPNASLTRELREHGAGVSDLEHNRTHHLVDLLRAKNPNLTSSHIAELLPLELQAGLRMDLNRPFGNGRDDDLSGWPRNGVVDEPEEIKIAFETLGGESFEQWKFDNVTGKVQKGTTTGRLVEGNIDVNGDGNVDADDQAAVRQLYARHLYVLAMLLTENTGAAPPYWTDDASRARFLAQWAVNVADFRDRDSIMTRFDYDPTPFDDDGWNPPGDINHRVWGVERPELLISETLAFHDRRTEDLAEPDKTTHEEEEDERDEDFDQRIKPEGSLFIELYNPGGPADALSGEFCWDRAPPLGSPPEFAEGVRLNQTSPGGDAVWRLIIAQPEQEASDPQYPKDPDDPNNPPGTIERSIRFVDPGENDPIDGDGKIRHYPSNSSNLAPVKPGRYAVIGTGTQVSSSPPTWTTYLGFRDDGTSGNADTRRIELMPNSNPESTWVGVVDNREAGKDDLQKIAANIQRPVAVVIDAIRKFDGTSETRRLSITEPDDGYPAYEDGGSQYNPIRDVPLDKELSDWDVLKTNDLHPRYRVVYLQRLANPLRDYHSTDNPYRTVDSMPIDLTTFNGVTSAAAGGDDAGGGGGTESLFTRERGDKDPAGANYLWTQEPLDGNPRTIIPDVAECPIANGHYFQNRFAHSLGYLNRSYCYYEDPDNGTASYVDPRSTPDEYRGTPPGKPFPWLTWNNRPFATPQELLLVPNNRSSQVFKRFTPAGSTNGYTNVAGAFSHLLNFFYTDDGTTDRPQFYRLFDFVQVRSPFVGTEIQGDADKFAATSGHTFHPPANGIPTYREPGRINLNTVFSRDVFRAFLNLPDLTDGNLWDEFVESRRGYSGPDHIIGVMSDDYPTMFARPFRSYAGKYFVPTEKLRDVVGNEIDSTIFRAHPSNSAQPLFEYQLEDNPEYSNTNRNPFFRYQLLQRLGNSVTTRSNVYAVWITVGFFEVEWVGTSSVHPDGYALGQELGSDTGEIKRHRAFYIIDRSIPVGFRRGEDLNSGNCVLLKRFIE
jgi:hypothetical protein